MYDTPQSRGQFTVHIRLRTVECNLLAPTIPSGHVSPCKGPRAYVSNRLWAPLAYAEAAIRTVIIF